MKLYLRLLGAFTVEHEGTPLGGFISHKARAAMAYLSMHPGQLVPRNRLATLFWPEHPTETARKNLRQVLSNVRKVLGEAAGILTVTREFVCLHPDGLYVDAWEVQRLVEESQQHPHRRIDACRSCLQRLTKAVDLYQGEFLEGLRIPDCLEFQEWVTIQRERLHILTIEALLHIAAFYELQREYAIAARYARRLLSMEPWNEESHRRLMRIMAQQGQRTAALRQYEVCRRYLEQEMGLSPTPETTALYERIRDNVLDVPIKPPLHLPAALTPFFGREQEIAALMERLQNPHTRLVTLVGFSGVGKTRLAARVAEQAYPLFQDGVYWVALEGVEDPASLPATIAESLQLSVAPGEDILRQVQRFLRPRSLLLVLDSIEHLLDDAADVVHRLLTGAPRLVILVTSHRPLHLQAEHVYPLHGLPTPEEEAPHHVAEFDSLRLFQDRACRMQPDFVLNEHTLPHAARICRLVGGMPLGIELAAHNVHLTPIEQIAERIAQRLEALGAGFQDLPDRHRSLHTVFEYTWEHLPPADRRVLSRIAIFRESFRAQDACAIAQISPEDLSRLAATALLSRQGERYHLHPLLRRFCRERLTPDEHRELMDRFSRHFLDWLNELTRQNVVSRPQRHPREVARIEQEYGNLHTALLWRLLHQPHPQVLPSLHTLMLFLDVRGRAREILSFTGRVLKQLPESLPLLHAHLESFQSVALMRLGQLRESCDLQQRVLDDLPPEAGAADRLMVLNRLAAVELMIGEIESSIEHARQALTLARQTANRKEEARALNFLGIGLGYRGQVNEARTMLRRSLHLYRQMEDDLAQVRLLISLGNSLMLSGEVHQAREHFQQALQLAQRIGFHQVIPLALNAMGLIAIQEERYEEALPLFTEGVQMAQALQNPDEESLLRLNRGDTLLQLGRMRAATQEYLRALEMGWEAGSLSLVLGVLTSVADIFHRQGKHMRALELIEHIRAQPQTRQETLETLDQLLPRVEQACPPNAQEALERGRQIPLDVQVQRVQHELHALIDQMNTLEQPADPR